MNQIQLIQVTPKELADLIAESINVRFKELTQGKESKPTDEVNDLLTRKETAELLQVSLVTLREWTRAKILTHFKMGNRTYYRKSQVLEKLFNSNTTVG